jgi:hypothetical protein
MVGAVRLELTTYRLKADYSNQLSYAPISCHSCHCPLGLSLKNKIVLLLEIFVNPE